MEVEYKIPQEYCANINSAISANNYYKLAENLNKIENNFDKIWDYLYANKQTQQFINIIISYCKAYYSDTVYSSHTRQFGYKLQQLIIKITDMCILYKCTADIDKLQPYYKNCKLEIEKHVKFISTLYYYQSLYVSTIPKSVDTLACNRTTYQKFDVNVCLKSIRETLKKNIYENQTFTAQEYLIDIWLNICEKIDINIK